ncbi:NAD-dependent epimerase/dehydratase family protein [Fibrobacter intestinalis]|uniref:UDP-apiose/xylose synthase n=1 Tax=Fibrobacter intestinalis TaxID=28122 RepID=A0A1T4P9W8_9BACT|nr:MULTISPECIES: NAD-dependent epimerase/dehydratase family protein [Fibrobacter]PBC73008.1 UDP-apiose/xylose synthase [Fibrobacter sp. NR9]SJZ88181.1 UDP-apiose/xylose synthase [Fibrobacter intestinalis]
MSNSIALVGAGGFIGSHWIRALLARTDYRILAVDLDFHRIDDLRKAKIDRVDFLENDIADSEVIQKVAQCDIVVNLAAICTPSRYMGESLAVIESNFTHPAALAKACAESGAWLIYFSTSEVYGKTSAQAKPLDEDASDFVQGAVGASRWSYAVAKQLSERYIAALPNLRWSVVRPFNFVGPWMDFMPGVDGEGIPRVLANFSSALLKNEPMILVNGGVARRSFTAIDDAVEFMFCLLNHPEAAYAQAFNVGNLQNELSIRGLAEWMREIYAQMKGCSVESLPAMREMSGEEYYGKGYEDSLRRVPSVVKAERLLGFKARKPLRSALEESLKWFAEFYGIPS